MKIGDAITPKTDGYGKRKHFGCPACGGVYLLPWSDSYDPPWCHHGGTTGYAWPETHWQGGEELPAVQRECLTTAMQMMIELGHLDPGTYDDLEEE